MRGLDEGARRLHRLPRSPRARSGPCREVQEKRALTEKLQDRQGGGRQSYWGPSKVPAKERLAFVVL